MAIKYIIVLFVETPRKFIVHEQSGKVEYERERLLGTALKIH